MILQFLGTYGHSGDLKHAPDIAQAMGDLVAAWSLADWILLVALHRILGIPQTDCAIIFYSIPTFDGRVKLIKNLLKASARIQGPVDNLLRAIEGLRGLSGTRNSLIHGNWAIGNLTNETVIFDYLEPAGPKRKRSIKAHDILGHVEAVNRRRTDLYQAVQQALPEVPVPPPAPTPKRGHP